MRRTLSSVLAFSLIAAVLACSLAASASSQLPQNVGRPTKSRAAQDKRRKPVPAPRRQPGAMLGARQTAAVAVKNFEFQPKTLTVKSGTLVTWTNEAGAHTVTADDDSFSSETLSAGQTFTHRFARKGTYRYHCTLHGSAGGHDMAGTVVVR